VESGYDCGIVHGFSHHGEAENRQDDCQDK